MSGLTLSDLFRSALSVTAEGFAADTADELDLIERFGEVVGSSVRVKRSEDGEIVSSSLFTHSVDAKTGERWTVVHTIVADFDDGVLGGELETPSVTGGPQVMQVVAGPEDEVEVWLVDLDGEEPAAVEPVTAMRPPPAVVEPAASSGRSMRVVSWRDDDVPGWKPWQPW